MIERYLRGLDLSSTDSSRNLRKQLIYVIRYFRANITRRLTYSSPTLPLGASGSLRRGFTLLQGDLCRLKGRKEI